MRYYDERERGIGNKFYIIRVSNNHLLKYFSMSIVPKVSIYLTTLFVENSSVAVAFFFSYLY
jgi:hypothetical protein